jgi:hypothetical protein
MTSIPVEMTSIPVEMAKTAKTAKKNLFAVFAILVVQIPHERGIMNRGYTCLWRKVWSNTVLAEPGKRFSRFEAWLYITNVLAAGIDAQAAGLKRGEFVGSVRQLAECFNWSRGAMLRFLETLSQNSMIMRVGHSAGHPAGQEMGHFSVCNYETYNPSRYTERDTQRDTERDTFKEVFKESINKIKDTHMPSVDGDRVPPKIPVDIFRQHNQLLPEVKAITAMGRIRGNEDSHL